MLRPCEVCGGAEVYANDLCRSDYRFRLRHGRLRTPAEVKRLQRRRQAAVDARYHRRVEAEEVRVLLKIAESHACNS